MRTPILVALAIGLTVSFPFALNGCVEDEADNEGLPWLADRDENGFLVPGQDGWIRNGTCVPHGERFTETYACENVEGPSTTTPPGAESRTSYAHPDRLMDPDHAWVMDEVNACSCVCCHSEDAKASYRWAADFDPFWLDSADDKALNSLAGYNHSGTKDYLDPTQNNGFTRVNGFPTTDPDRMQAYFDREIARRAEGAP